MEVAYNYYIWHPRLLEGGLLVFNVTPGEQGTFAASKEFMTDLIGTFKLPTKITSSRVLAYRASYQGEPDADDWEDRWPVNWRVSVKLKKPLQKLPRLKHEYVGSLAFSADALDEEIEEEIAGLVIADFKSRDEADKARETIRASAKIQDLAAKYKVTSPKFERITLSESLIQEQICLGMFLEPFNKSGAKYATAVEQACRSAGGFTSFEERTSELEELFDQEGLE